MRLNKKFIAGLILVLLFLSLPLIAPFFQKGYFTTHDGEWAVVRLADMYREVRDGQIPPRFSGNLNSGYGYPLFQYAYPMPYYLGLVLYLFQIGLVDSIKILFASTVFLSGVAMFFLSRSLWKSNIAGIVSAILYMYAPYRLVDLYVRGSIGESIASVFFPLILLTMLSLRERITPVRVVLLSLLTASLVLTHNIMAVLFLVIILGFFIYFLIEKDFLTIKASLIGIVGGFMLSAYFWIPALLEKKYILLSIIPIADRSLHFVSLNQLILPTWGYGTPTDPDAFTYQIGLAHIFVVFLIGVTFFLKKKDLMRNITTLFFILISVFLFLMFPLSKVIWENTPLLHEINYPWTCLMPIIFLSSIIAGKTAITNFFPLQKIIVGIACVAAIFFGITYARPNKIVDNGDGFYFTNDATTTSSKELMPLWVKDIPQVRPKNKIEIIKGIGNISPLHITSHKALFETDLKTDAIIRFNTIYFPQWEWKVDGKNTPYSYNNRVGVMDAHFTKGHHNISIVLRDTPIRIISNSISFVTFVVFVFVIVVRFLELFLKRRILIFPYKL
ncbi:MAG: hypothetical protein HZC02_04350 [Candidatus Levybacteria bacterium]|nr:hypothetical protein [Candidatus Levybacteria bacterium]